ncbi:hypothetical protein [Paraglaciecola hydrolytica]|uniref:STAS/SEC14 domain-containing protein n=1 Tax=Paraglaciecola hydrolytica TaxID=1799789 RepID=A0A136A447_9ALTE|nr:hypothetical protein [Paraglaciecola hydrolytica]KXI29994.1 hypothetical protein AX660_08265 [Paraglaciecola hydrolytica]
MSRFSVHGTVNLDITDSILVVEGRGPWNKESVIQGDKSVAPLLQKLLGKPWGVLVTLYGEPIYVPEAATILSKTIKSQKKLGRVATAVIVVESQSPEFAKTHLAQIYQNAGEPVRFFNEHEQAKWWLVQQISQQTKVHS